ncbi:tRNA lysidine(34) synthetase TilS [Lacticaseibacillus baoqingensis]|uniref:tRNA(Ile)-lysidine synthase n=2 Tax=Lacticaseibacillus baoqingensis TaxID=2486013 RepID=A0ABW4E9W1_9LACO
MLSGEALLAPFALPPQAPLVIGVSGGVDSMVLLTLLAQTTHPVIAAQFDHQLRPQSAAEAQLVADYATRLGAVSVLGQWPQAAHPQSGIEAAARTARYDFLVKAAHLHHAAYLVVAHHADDQLETILWQLARSGNVMKMAGMTAQRPQADLQVLRPLLGISKKTLYAYAQQHQIPFAEDATNQDMAMSRNRIRQQVTPVLKTLNPQVLAHTARFSQGLQGLLSLAQPALAQLVAACVTGTQAHWSAIAAQPQTVQRLVLETILTQWQVQATAAVVDALLAAWQTGAGHKVFSVAGGQLIVNYHTLQWQAHGSQAPSAKAITPVRLRLGTWQALPNGTQIGVFAQKPPLAAQWALVPDAAIMLRLRQPGDRVCLADGHHKLLRRWLIDHKVPQAQRAQTLVAACGQTIFWVQGMPGHELFHEQRTDIMQAVLALQPPIR